MFGSICHVLLSPTSPRKSSSRHSSEGLSDAITVCLSQAPALEEQSARKVHTEGWLAGDWPLRPGDCPDSQSRPDQEAGRTRGGAFWSPGRCDAGLCS